MQQPGERQATTDDIASGGRPAEGERQGGGQSGAGRHPDQGTGGGGYPAEGAPAGAPPEGAEYGSQGAAPGGGATTAAGGGATTEPGGAGPGAGTAGDDHAPLLPDHDARDFEGRWERIQVGFVDEPQRCVQEADGLVAEVMQRLADGFARERKELESQWSSGGEVSTEDLRVALQRYRSFFNRLLRTG